MASKAETPQPLISVIIPAYNPGKAIIDTVRSVLDQTESDLELLVVDDCSPQDFAQFLAEFSNDGRLRIVRHAVNGGATAARNTGLEQARGHFVAFLDADDSWFPRKLERQLAAVRSRPDPDHVFCVTKSIINLGGGRELVRPVRGKRPDERMDEFIMVSGNFCQTSSFFLSRTLARQIGWRELAVQAEDHLFAIDAINAGAEYLLIDEPLATYNNDIRPGRLSDTTSLERGRRYIAEMRGVLSSKALAGYESRYLGPLILRDTPLRGAAMVAKAVATGALPVRFAVTLLARAVLPVHRYHRIRALVLGEAR